MTLRFNNSNTVMHWFSHVSFYSPGLNYVQGLILPITRLLVFKKPNSNFNVQTYWEFLEWGIEEHISTILSKNSDKENRRQKKATIALLLRFGKPCFRVSIKFRIQLVHLGVVPSFESFDPISEVCWRFLSGAMIHTGHQEMS